MNNSFLSRQWCNQIEPDDFPSLSTATREAAYIDGIISILVSIGDVHVCACFAVGKSFAVDVLFGSPLSAASSGEYFQANIR